MSLDHGAPCVVILENSIPVGSREYRQVEGGRFAMVSPGHMEPGLYLIHMAHRSEKGIICVRTPSRDKSHEIAFDFTAKGRLALSDSQEDGPEELRHTFWACRHENGTVIWDPEANLYEEKKKK